MRVPVNKLYYCGWQYNILYVYWNEHTINQPQRQKIVWETCLSQAGLCLNYRHMDHTPILFHLHDLCA